MEKESIKISELNLWDENPRFPEEYFGKSETELIDFLLNKKGEKEKLLELAKSISETFNDIIPWERLIVYRTNDKNVVLEGNRRLMIYKLLINPNMTSREDVKRYFIELRKNLSINEGFLLECLVTTKKEEGLRYVELKHLESGYQPWGESERNNFRRRRGSKEEKIIIKTEIDSLVKGLDIPQQLKDAILGKGYVTTFYRVAAENVAKEFFGYKINDGKLMIEDKQFEDKFKVIIWDLFRKEDKNGNKLDSRTLNKKEDIFNYLKSISENDFERVEKEIEKSKKENLFGEEIVLGEKNKKKKIKSNPKITSRNKLIPKNLSLKINQDKINLIFYELRDELDLTKTINAAGVLFRVFLETTLDHFAEQTGMTFKKDEKMKGKITKVADKLENDFNIPKKKLTNIRKVATQNPNILSIENFHEYVHSLKVIPKPADLILKWNELQEFFEIVYNQILINKK